jgi:AraC-like DNA-binding protein
MRTASREDRVMQAQSGILHFTTDAFAPRERIAAWREIYGRELVQLEFEPADANAFSGEARMRALPGLGLGSIRMAQSRFAGPRHLINSDAVVLVTQESGRWSGTHLGRDVSLGPGDAVLGWTAETVLGQAEGETSIIRVPTAAIAPMVGDIQAGMNRRIPAGTEALRLLRPYARMLMDGSPSGAMQSLAVTHVCDLIALMCGASGDAAAVATERGGRAALLRAVKIDIARAMRHGEVSLDAIAARHRVAPRTVQKLFGGEGTTFSEYVLEARLALAHRMLADPRRSGEKIASIAFSAGFGDLSYFYRAFRRRYGALPTDIRARHGEADPTRVQ